MLDTNISGHELNARASSDVCMRYSPLWQNTFVLVNLCRRLLGMFACSFLVHCQRTCTKEKNTKAVATRKKLAQIQTYLRGEPQSGVSACILSITPLYPCYAWFHFVHAMHGMPQEAMYWHTNRQKSTDTPQRALNRQ